MTSKIDAETEDLGVKIGTPEQAAWKQVKDMSEQRILQNNVNAELDELIKQHATTKLAELEESQ